MPNFLRVLRNRNLGLLVAGRVVSSGGDWLYQIALSVATFHFSHGDSLYVGFLWVVLIVPSLVLGSYGGGLADRLGYRRAMIVADVGRLVIVGLLAATLGSSTWGIIYPAAFLVACLGNIFYPGSVGIIPSLVESEDDLVSANAALTQASSVATIVGSALGAIIAGLGWINQLLAIEATTFGVSALTLLLIRTRAAPAPTEEPHEPEPAGGKKEGFISGVRLLADRPLMVFSAIVMTLPEFASGALVVWVVPYADRALHLGNAGIGYIYCALGIGSFLGGFGVARLGANTGIALLLAAGTAVVGAAIAVFGLVHVAAVALVAIFILGVSQTFEYVAYDTVLQQAVPVQQIGRAAGTMSSWISLVALVGTATSGFILAALGITASITGLGVLVVLGAGIGWMYLQRATADQPSAQTLAAIPAFAQVPLPAREWVVRRLALERAAAQAVLIRQGDIGDKLYFIARGEVQVDVSQNGASLTRRLGPGDVFGEMALLHRAPRNATVTALGAVTLWTMSSADFAEIQSRSDEFTKSLRLIATQRLQDIASLAQPVTGPPGS